jgi:hypothetical protein
MHDGYMKPMLYNGVEEGEDEEGGSEVRNEAGLDCAGVDTWKFAELRPCL